MFLRSNRPPTIEFYRYDNFRGTCGFVGYHAEETIALVQNGQKSISEHDLDDSRPLFLYHGKGEAWYEMQASLSCNTGQILEVQFEVRPNEIYIARDRHEYHSLFEFPVEQPDGYEVFGYSRDAMRLIHQGKRWFLLVDDPRGENESFIALASRCVSNIVPLYIPL